MEEEMEYSSFDTQIEQAALLLVAWLSKHENADIRRAYELHDDPENGWYSFEQPDDPVMVRRLGKLGLVFALTPEQSKRWNTFVHDSFSNEGFSGAAFIVVMQLTRRF